MSQVFKRGNAAVESNLTPMIDVTFLLIIFFVLVSRIVDIERVDLALPQPEDPASMKVGDEPRAVVNIMPDPDGGAQAYRLGTRSFAPDEAGQEAVIERLAELYRANPELHVTLRADYRTEYRAIAPVMRAVSRAARRSGRDEALARVNLAIMRDDRGGGGPP